MCFCFAAVCGVFSVAQHHYLVFNETKTWTEAQSFCREQFADLATVDNMEDMNNLNGMAVPQVEQRLLVSNSLTEIPFHMLRLKQIGFSFLANIVKEIQFSMHEET